MSVLVFLTLVVTGFVSCAEFGSYAFATRSCAGCRSPSAWPSNRAR